MKFSKLDLATHSTLLIEVIDEKGDLLSTGTGFIYNFCEDSEANTCIPALVTNKHVINNTKNIRLTFTLADEKHNPLFGQTQSIIVPTNDFIFHPDNDVDLAILPIAFINKYFYDNNINIYYIPLFKELLPTETEWNSYNSIEEIVMIGYPKGLWDTAHNLPLLRKGITSTHPSFDFKGKKEFLIDAACYPGSSGSPVFLYNLGYIWDKGTDNFKLQNRLKLLGIMYSGPLHNAEGITLNQTVTLASGKTTITPILINLGYVIKSSVLLDFEELLK